MCRIALFGTSADPPTIGHQAIVQWLSQNFDLVAVWASDNPFKPLQMPLEHRTNMLLLLIDELNSELTNVGVYPDLASRWTVETVAHARQKWPKGNFTLVIGSDLVSQLPRWYQVEELLKQIDLLIVPRLGYPLLNINLDTLYELGGKVAIATFIPPEISSTVYREQGNKEAITPAIAAYIHRERLYQCLDVLPKKAELNL